MRSIHLALREAAEENAARTAFNVLDDGIWRSITYREFYRMAQSAAGALMDTGIEEGGRVAIISPNRPQWCASYWGALMIGAIVVPMDVRLTHDEVRNILVDSSSRVIVTGGEPVPVVRRAIEGLEGMTVLEMDSMNWDSPAVVDEIEKGPDDLAALLYTSGTTGAPKAVMLTHGNIMSDAESVAGLEIIVGSDNVLSVLPLHHTYAFMGTFLVPALLGAQITYPAGLSGPDLISASNATGGTVLVAVPLLLELLYRRMKEKLDALPYGLSGVMHALMKISGVLDKTAGISLMPLILHPLGRQFRFFASGGARLAPEVMLGLQSLGFMVVEGYGLTETSPVVTFNPLNRRKPGSVGIAIPGAEIRILNPSEKGEGEIAIGGPMVMKGYYKKPVETAQVLKDGWFRSGDLGYIDPEGYVFITGRIKEVIVLPSGKNIYPEEVETHYMKIPLVREICVMEHKGRLHAVIVPDMELAKAQKIGNLTEAIKWEITKHSSGLPPHMRVMGFSVSTAPLPRTPLGKLRRFMIKAEVVDRRNAGEAEASLLSDDEGRKLVQCIKSFTEEGVSVRPSDNLEIDLGLDSLKRVELAVSIESAFGIRMPEGMMAEVHTVDELLSRIRAVMHGVTPSGAVLDEMSGLDAILGREPSEDIKRAAGVYRNPVEWAGVVLIVTALRLLFRVVYGFRVKGMDGLPKMPYIMVANHTSYLDAFVVGTALPIGVFRDTYIQGDRKYFDHGFGALVGRLAHVIPIDADSSLGGALQMSSFVLKGNGGLLIFPEGGRSFDGRMVRFRKGIGILAEKLGVPVVPVKIVGAYEAWSRHQRWPGAGRISVIAGKAVAPPVIAPGDDPDAVYQQYADMIQKHVEGLGGD